MAGSYPDAPFRRMAWDEDGSIFWHANTTAGTFTSTILPGNERTVPQKEKHNNEATIGGSDVIDCGSFVSGASATAMAIIFPELRDIWGIAYWCVTTLAEATDVRGRRKPNDVQVSGNSPNSISGDWVSLYAGVINAGAVGDPPTYPVSAPSDVYSWDHWYRIGIVTENLPVTGVRTIRWLQQPGENLIGSSRWHHIHLYGDKSAGATPDRLLFIDVDTGVEFTGPLDWGDVPRGTTLVHDIQVKNNSATLTANDIDLDFEALTGESDTWHTISDSGGAFGGTMNITSIAPLATYPAANVLTVKLTVALDENLGPNACRLEAQTASWT